MPSKTPNTSVEKMTNKTTVKFLAKSVGARPQVWPSVAAMPSLYFFRMLIRKNSTAKVFIPTMVYWEKSLLLMVYFKELIFYSFFGLKRCFFSQYSSKYYFRNPSWI
ncbi:hypothetical protein K1F36_18380 [Muricauda sp. W52]|uniref:Uncharacterized protein n=1 Tax=Flagellimonas abyssi TaxID=2864871 RepID=A0ABS7EW17_9FLAO|nr:hypothetical protein [Allomuricauda abyssi]